MNSTTTEAMVDGLAEWGAANLIALAVAATFFFLSAGLITLGKSKLPSSSNRNFQPISLISTLRCLKKLHKMDCSNRGPAKIILDRATTLRDEYGHENNGSLSLERGFLPTTELPLFLPDQWSAWEMIVADLPRHYRDLTLRHAVRDSLPLLGTDDLPDKYLQRANALLSFLAHTFWHVEAAPPKPSLLPDSISTPWKQIRKRLGRPNDPVMSYTELIVANWRMKDENAKDPFALDNLTLNIATVNNPTEHRFYLVQVRVLVVGSPIIGLSIQAQEAVLNDDQDALKMVLENVRPVLKMLSETIRDMSPNQSSKAYMSPVALAKTVAELAIPMTTDMKGPSGTANPIFPLLDGLLGRRSAHSQIGKEMELLKLGYPILWREYLKTFDEIRIDDYVARKGCESLKILYLNLQNEYAGPNGFLGRHRRKVQGYIEVALRLGRASTVGGFRGGRTWDVIDRALEEARQERLSENCSDSTSETESNSHIVSEDSDVLPVISYSEVSRHITNDSAWCVIDNKVYDMTKLLKWHPGGDTIIRLRLGRDCTRGYQRAHSGVFTDPTVSRQTAKMQIGTLFTPDLTNTDLADLHGAWKDALEFLTEMRTTLMLDHTTLDLVVSSADADAIPGRADSFLSRDVHPPCAFLRQRGFESHQRFLLTYVHPILDQTLPTLEHRVEKLVLVQDGIGVHSSEEALGTNLKVPDDWVERINDLLCDNGSQQLEEIWAQSITKILERDQCVLHSIALSVRSGLVELEEKKDRVCLVGLSKCLASIRKTVIEYLGEVEAYATA